jgi:hypothetical protein
MLFSSQPGSTRVHHNDVFMNEDGIGIFTSPGGGVEVSYNNSRNNLTDGIVVIDQSQEHLIVYNKAFENGRFDCRDNSTGKYNGLALVANRWVKDLGGGPDVVADRHGGRLRPPSTLLVRATQLLPLSAKPSLPRPSAPDRIRT